MKVAPTLVAVLLQASLLSPAPARAAEIRTTSERVEDTVASISTQGGQLVVGTGAGKTFALAQVKEIRFSDRAPARVRDAHLWLLSGEELMGTIGDEVKAGDSFELRTASLGVLRVPLDAVGAIVFDVTPEREERIARKQLRWLLEGAAAGERAYPSGDRFTLLTTGGRKGHVERFSQAGLVFVDDDPKITWPTFPLKRLESLVLGGKPPARGTGLRVLLRLLDGSVVIAPVQKLEDHTLTLLHPLGRSGFLVLDVDKVLSLEVLGGAVTYLSDLSPARVDESFPEGFERDEALFGWKRDREVLGEPLRLGGKTFRRGLGVHARSALTFPLEGGFKELRAVVGLDDSTKHSSPPLSGEGPVAAVTFRVLVDGKVAKELRKGLGEAPDEIAVSVAGAKEVTLVADYGDYLHVLGRADWADAHLVK